MSSPPLRDFADFQLLCDQVAGQEPRRLDKSEPVWIFGAGQFGRDVCSVLVDNGYKVCGFIESKPLVEQIDGLPVLAWSQLQAEHLAAQLVIGIYNRGMPLDQLDTIGKTAGFTDIYLPWDIYAQFGPQLGWRFWLSAPDLILENLPAIERAYQSLTDEASRQSLLGICAFRLGHNRAYASFTHPDTQYFNALTIPALAGKKTVYVDGGAFNGDTLFELARETEISAAYLFEPDLDNFNTLVAKVAQAAIPAVCLPMALADHHGILAFNSGKGESGAIAAGGLSHIAAGALDEVLPVQTVDFIKLDVEGSEIQALDGAARLIKRSRPVMAISLYHCPQDIWEIPLKLAQICDNYHYFIRQHFNNSFDSVIYAIPK